MKAQELANFLSKFPEHEVLLSSDAEGNGYGEYDGQPSIMYVEKSNTEARLESGDVVDQESIYEEVEEDEDQDGIDPLQNFKPVVVLFPV